MNIYSIGTDIEYDGVVNCSLKECIDYCADKKELGLDIETTYLYPKNTYPNENIYKPGLDPYLSKVVMIQIGDLENLYVIDSRKIDISPLLPVLNDSNKLFIGSNLRFEAKHLGHNYGVILHNIWDVMLVDMCLTNGLGWSKENPSGFRYSLLAMSERYLGIKNASEIDLFKEQEEGETYLDKTIRLGFLSIGDKPFSREQILYGAGDIEYPIKIRDIQKEGRGGYFPEELIKLENQFCLVLADIELKGVGFDPKQWLSVYESKLPIYESRLQKLNDYVIKHYPKFVKPADLFGSPTECSIQWTSSDQVIKLFKFIGKCPKERSKQTKRMEYTVGAKALNKLLPSALKDMYMNDIEKPIESFEDFVLMYLLFKTAEQAITTFGKDWLKYIHPITKRVHTSFQQILNTGRISSTNPNVQNIPTEKEYRMAFIAAAGRMLLNADFSSQEIRVMAEKCGDEGMLKFFNEGDPFFKDDFHSFMGTRIWRAIRKDPNLVITKDTHPKERLDAKTLVFKTLYGGSAYTLKDDFGVTEQEAETFIEGFYAAVPSLRKYFDGVIKEIETNGWIEIDDVTGRRWHSPFFHKLRELNKRANSYYPKNYNFLSKEKREAIKLELKEKHPELKEIWSEYFSLKGKLGRLAQNFPFQGTAGGQTKKFAVLFREYQLENNLRDKIYLTSLVHDECLAECSPEYAEQGKLLIEQKMVEGAELFCKKVKMKAECGIVKFWYH